MKTFTLKIYYKMDEETKRLYGNSAKVGYIKDVKGRTYADSLKAIPQDELSDILSVRVINKGETNSKLFDVVDNGFVFVEQTSKWI